MLDASVAHGFTHFDLELALAVGDGDGHGPGQQAGGEWWPVGDLAAAGLPTVFAKAAAAIGTSRRAG